MPTTKAELLQGTLDLRILKTLTAGPLRGYPADLQTRRPLDINPGIGTSPVRESLQGIPRE